MSARVVVAEDDVKQAELVRRYLKRDGYDVTVVHDGPAAIEAVRRIQPYVLVLDVMLPGIDGFSVCGAVTAESDVSVVMLTSRSQEDDLIRGLNLGADDYLTKPFSPRELAARVRAVIRRRDRGAPDDEIQTFTAGEIVVDTTAHEVRCRGEQIKLTPGEFVLLEHFVRSPGRAFTRSQLLDFLHGSDQFITLRSVDMHVMNLRRKVEADPRRPTRLVTVYGVGYKLIAD